MSEVDPASVEPVEATRMTLGEHLDELRRVVIRSLVALILGFLLCIWPARFLLELIARPVILVLRRYGQPENLLATGPAELILVYVKVAAFCGLLVALPYVANQLWQFVSAGLYDHEKGWVRQIVPISVGLFLAGAAFMYTLVLVVSLNFLVGFAGWIPLPAPEPNALERLLLHEASSSPATVPSSHTTSVTIMSVEKDPTSPEPGQVWFNLTEHRLKLRQGGGETFSVSLQPDSARGLVTTHFRIGEYLNFVLLMMVAFGLAFQTPLVVLFLSSSGIMPVATIRSYRKIIWLGIVIIAGILAPPDLVSHLLLSIPMVLLFELGILLSARRESGKAAATNDGTEVAE